MLKKIMTSLSLCLQGTPLQFRPKRRVRKQDGHHRYVQDNTNAAPPYLVIAAQEGKFRADILSLVRVADNRLMDIRFQDQQARTRLFPDTHQTMYIQPQQATLNPQIELYYRKLGLGQLISESPLGC